MTRHVKPKKLVRCVCFGVFLSCFYAWGFAHWFARSHCRPLFSHETLNINEKRERKAPLYARAFTLYRLLRLFSYLQAENQTDLENWVTAIHSASASHLAKRQGKEDTLRLLKNQSRSLLQKIDMDGKMKKMAELQLSVISDQKNRKAIESQVRNKTDVCVCLWMLIYMCVWFVFED